MQKVTQAVLAERLDVTRSAISKAVSAGRLTVDADGLLDLAGATAQWATNRQRRRSRSRSTAAAAAGAAAPRNDDGDFWMHKTRREAAEAQIAELKLAELAGTLVLREEVNRTLFGAARVMRDQMLAIAPRLAATLSAVSDPALIEARISDEVRVGLAAFAQQMRSGGYPAVSQEQLEGGAP